MAEVSKIQEQSNEYELKRSVKNSMGLAVFAVVMTLVAIGAGVYIVIDKMTDEQRINDAISKNCLTPADPKQGVPTVDPDNGNGTVVPDITDSTVTPNASDYIYIADWGVKVKKPADYYVWYRVIPDTGSFPGAKLELSASHKDAQQWANYGDFDNGGRLLQIVRTTENNAFDGVGSGPSLIGQIGDYYYWYYTPQACSAAMGGDHDSCVRENEVFNAIKPTFADLNNWSIF